MESGHLLWLFFFGILMQTENVHAEGPKDSVSASRTVPPDQFDDRTLLDAFGEAAKHYLTPQQAKDYGLIDRVLESRKELPKPLAQVS